MGLLKEYADIFSDVPGKTDCIMGCGWLQPHSLSAFEGGHTVYKLRTSYSRLTRLPKLHY